MVLDWAGTAVDFGSRAPVVALQRVFEKADVPVTTEEIRQGMGLLKKDHVRSILELPRVTAAWQAVYGGPPTESDVDRLFSQFIPAQSEVLEQYSDVIPGVAAAADRWRSAGLRIGSTTGYTRGLMDCVCSKAEAQGYRPDATVTPDLVGAGRPLPFMMYRNALDLRVWPLWACVKIGDTPVDMQEGVNAGAWCIGITATGNETGLSQEEFAALSAGERARRLVHAESVLRGAGAQFIAASAAECDSLLEEIDALLAAGRRPSEPRS